MLKLAKTDRGPIVADGTRYRSMMARVWDPIVRVFHWLLVASFAIAWFSPVWMGGVVHHWTGYLAAALVLTRVLWGIFGTHYARFAQFVRKPETVFGYLRAMLSGREPRYLGHNPAGGMMVLVLICGMVAASLTGWMMTTDRFFGVEWVETLHSLVVHGMLLLVVIHLAGVFLASFRHKENLVLAMITGNKRRDGDDFDRNEKSLG